MKTNCLSILAVSAALFAAPPSKAATPGLELTGDSRPFASLAATAALPGQPSAASPLITLNNPVVAASGGPAGGALPAAGPSAAYVRDQQNTTGGSGGAQGMQGFGVGQSFTPSTATLNAVTASIYASAGNSTATLQIFLGSGFGTLLATGTPTTFTNTSFQDVELTLPTPLTLTPGTVYTLRVFATTGAYFYNQSTTDVYAGGVKYNSASGTADATRDLVFSEGFDPNVGVPEPATWLGGALLGGLALLGTRRRVRRA